MGLWRTSALAIYREGDTAQTCSRWCGDDEIPQGLCGIHRQAIIVVGTVAQRAVVARTVVLRASGDGA